MTSSIPTMTRMTQGNPPGGTGALFRFARTGLNFPISAMVSPCHQHPCKNRI